MWKFLLIFAVGCIWFVLRLIIGDPFELVPLIILLLLLSWGLFIFSRMRWQYKKDEEFRPEENETHLVTRIRDRVSTKPKKMYNNKDYIASYYRFYHNKWKRINADFVKHPGSWYLNLSFSLENNDKILFKGGNEKEIEGNDNWVIYRNNREMGTIQTDLSTNNEGKPKESLFLYYLDTTYHFKSFSIDAKTDISCGSSIIAKGEKCRKSVYQLTMEKEEREHDKVMLFMVYILFIYQFEL